MDLEVSCCRGVLVPQNKVIHIVHVIGIMNRGGAETMIMNLYRNIDRTKIQFDFVENTTERAAYDEEIEQLGGRIYHCPRFRGFNYPEYRNWWRRFFHEYGREFAAVHGHLGSTAAIYLAEAKRYGIFTIAHSHNTRSALTCKRLCYDLLSYRTRFIADFFFACSKEAGRDRFGVHTVQGHHFKVIRNAIDVNEFRYDENIRRRARTELGIGEKDLVVGHVGRFEKQKNHRFLIECFCRIAGARKNAKLLLIGDGILKKEMEEKVRHLGLEDKVIFAGVRKDVGFMLQAMDIFLFPSHYEGLGIALIEAQAAGLPCIISDVVPDEAVLIRKLVRKLSLEEGPKAWAIQVLQAAKHRREDCSDAVKKGGYDIHSATEWMEAFYLGKGKK